MSNTATATSRPQPSRSPRQTQTLEKGCKNRIPGLENRVPPRSDLEFSRPKARHPRPELSNPELLEALLWMHARRGREWDDSESDTVTEVLARSWGEVQCRSAATHHVPSWFLAVLPGRTAYGCALFCYFVLASHRAGALGVVASYTELAALCMVSERTVQRWAKRLETGGFLEVVQTWQRNPNRGRKRGYWKHLYRPGPAMREIAGMGMLEGAKGLTDATANFARRCARVARARLRAEQKARSDALWRARNSRRAQPSPPAEKTPKHAQRAPRSPSLSLDMLATPSPSSRGRDIGPPSSLGGTGAPSAPPHEEERPTAVSVSATPAANAPRRAGHRHAETHPGRGPTRASPVPGQADSVETRYSPFAAWVEANEPAPARELQPPKAPADAVSGDYVDPYAAERKAFAEVKGRRRNNPLFFGSDER